MVILGPIASAFSEYNPDIPKNTTTSLPDVKESQEVDSGPIIAEKPLLEGLVIEEKLPVRIVAPSLSLDLEIKPARVVEGRWEVFEKYASFGTGSGLPGEKGNSVVFAHARNGLFGSLKNIKLGDKVYIFTQNSWFTYGVKDIKTVSPNDISVIKGSDGYLLTLYTCSGFADTKRLIVTAEKL